MSKHRRNAAHIPARREFIAKPHSVFRLPSSIHCSPVPLLTCSPATQPKASRKSPLSLYFLAPSCLSGYKSIMQNKPNVKMGNINISTANTKAYGKEQRTMSNERYSKQSQTKPISNAETAYPACRTKHCHLVPLRH